MILPRWNTENKMPAFKNQRLLDFYEQIVRREADKTGGVTVGISEPESCGSDKIE